MKEAERKYLDSVFGGNYAENKHKKEYRHLDTWQNNQSGIEAAQKRAHTEKLNNVNKIFQSSIQDMKNRGQITEQQALRMRNAL